MNDLQQKLAQVEREFPGYLKGALKRMPFLLQGYIGAEMDYREQQRDAIPTAPSKSAKLQTGRGALFQSFLPKGKGNFFEEHDDGFTIGSSLKYAEIHETGGFVKSKGKMDKFFWAMFYKTKSPYYRSLALAAKKHGGIHIRARPYFRAAEKKFESEGIPILHNIILKRIAEIINE